MTIAIALVLIFIFYLVDKHHRWRQAIIVLIPLIVLPILGLGGFVGWKEYQIRKAAANVCKDWEDQHPIGSPLETYTPEPEPYGGTPHEYLSYPPSGLHWAIGN